MRNFWISFCLVSALAISSNVCWAGTWDTLNTIVGIDGNPESSGDIKIKFASPGSAGCQVVKFKAGFGGFAPTSPAVSTQINRVYALALAAFISGKKVSTLVNDTANCYGFSMVIGEASF